MIRILPFAGQVCEATVKGEKADFNMKGSATFKGSDLEVFDIGGTYKKYLKDAASRGDDESGTAVSAGAKKASGKAPVVRRFPMIAGIDAAGALNGEAVNEVAPLPYRE